MGGRLRYVERDGFRIDQGPTIVLLPEMLLSILEEGGIPREEIDLIRIDPFYRITFHDGSTLWKWSDKEQMDRELRTKFPGEQHAYQRYWSVMGERFEEGKRTFLSRSFLRKRDFFTWKNTGALVRLRAHATLRRETDRFFRDSRLQEAFSFQSLYIGGNPMNTPALYSLIPYSEHEHGVWYLRGGYAGLIRIMEQELLRRGVRIQLHTPIVKLWIEDGACQGIVKEGGVREPYDRVILNGDFPGTLPLVKDYSDSPQVGKITKRQFEPSSGCLLLYWGLNRIYRDQQVHQFLFSADFRNMLQQVFTDKQLPKDPSIYLFHPSVIDESLAPEGKGVLYALIPVPSGLPPEVWQKQSAPIQTYVEAIIDRLEQGPFPGLRHATEWMELRTPADSESNGLFGGGSFGIAPTLKQSGVFRPQHSPYGISGLHAVGASIHPGGGVPIVMQGAKLLAEDLTHES